MSRKQKNVTLALIVVMFVSGFCPGTLWTFFYAPDYSNWLFLISRLLLGFPTTFVGVILFVMPGTVIDWLGDTFLSDLFVGAQLTIINLLSLRLAGLFITILAGNMLLINLWSVLTHLGFIPLNFKP